MKNLYLHIGTQKTATTSLQNFCLINRRRLHKYGYAFPIVFPKHPTAPFRRNAHFLADASPNYDATGCIAYSGDDTPEKQAAREKRLSRGLKSVHHAFDRFDNVILTDESMWLSLSYARRNPLDILCEDAKAHHYTIHVIVYLRRQDQFLISRWNQFIKYSAVRQISQTFSEYLDDIFLRWPLIADYASVLDQIAEKIGKENMTVRRFEASAWKGGSIYADFLDALKLDTDLPLKQPAKDSNTGLTLNYAELQRQLNADSNMPKKQKQFLEYCLRKASNSGPKRSEFSVLSTAETKDLLAVYEAGNNRIVNEYIGDNAPLFSGEVKEVIKWMPDNAYAEEDFCYLLSVISNISFGISLWKYKCSSFKGSVKKQFEKILTF